MATTLPGRMRWAPVAGGAPVGRALPPALVGLAAFLVSAAWSWQPSYWGDEAASVMSAQRPLPSLFLMLRHVDAVHGTYYLFLHVWTGLFGISEFATRLPSALAVGFAAAGTVVLVRQLARDTRWAVLSGILFAVLPRTTYMGAEARSYALVTALAVWATVLLVHILQLRQNQAARPVARAVWFCWWAGYALLFALTVNVFLYALLLVPAHAVAVWSSGQRHRPWPWLAATGVAVALAVPVLVWSVHERRQVAFIARRPGADLVDAAVDQWFGTTAIAVVAWALIVFGVVVTFRRHGGRKARATLALALVWMLFPTLALLVGTHLVTPVYTYRYLSMCAPAVGIAMAAGVVGIRFRLVRLAAVLLIVALAVPGYVAQRGRYAKNLGSDWRQVADLIAHEAEPGDAIVFDESVRPSRRPRSALHLYPQAFAGLRDVTLQSPFYDNPWLWDRTLPLGQVIDKLAGVDTVWLVQNKGSAENTAGDEERVLEAAGFERVSSNLANITVVIRMERRG
ncbi:glycosyltransferase family 39 protein [Cryobacterium tepidiphilum]|uniref:Uncharacterized protein n=1 Tax=Cryobacterium tepidiphilum TaxID=2486026 RepID=A0A3M8L2C6_9MICO|nr:glycosyltransferase family 39 protein [Cryobacterium tepidiphilum]RNE59049.1 hypothetical protein EEJ31_11615 [Cryobacterium tepidiphilum]